MAKLEDYSFGRISVDGERHTRDLIVLPDRVVPDWWRREGHSLAFEDLDDVMDELPERLILGCGAHGRLDPPEAVLDELRARGVEVAQPPASALVDAGDRAPRHVSLGLPLDDLDQSADVGRPDPDQHPVAGPEALVALPGHLPAGQALDEGAVIGWLGDVLPDQ